MNNSSGTVALMPYLTLDNALTIGEHSFLPLRQGLESEPIGLEEKSLLKTLSVFRRGKSHVEDGIVILLKDEQAAQNFHDSLLAFEFSLLGVPQHIVRLYTQHFEVVFHRLGTPDRDFIALEEGPYLTSGHKEDMLRTLPGPLGPQRILTQWLPRSGKRPLPECLVAALRGPDGHLLRRAITWFNRGFRWGNDSDEIIVDLITSIQVLFPVPQKQSDKKYDVLSSSLGGLTVTNPEQRRWVEAACRLRNRILHEGAAPPTDYVYRDEWDHPVLPHEVIAREFLLEAIKNMVSGEVPENELYAAVIAAIRESKFRSLLRSNKARLDAVLGITEQVLTFETLLQARTLLSLDTQDFSLGEEDCARYEQSLTESLELIRADPTALDDLPKLKNNMRHAIRELSLFRLNLQAGIFRLPENG